MLQVIHLHSLLFTNKKKNLPELLNIINIHKKVSISLIFIQATIELALCRIIRKLHPKKITVSYFPITMLYLNKQTHFFEGDGVGEPT
jgi:hypothetical protein